jgi:hypothetical protein
MLPSAIYTQGFAPLRQQVERLHTTQGETLDHRGLWLSARSAVLILLSKDRDLFGTPSSQQRADSLGMCNSPRRSYKLWGRHASQYHLGALQVYYCQRYNTQKKWEACSIENQGLYWSPRWGGGSSPLYFLESHMSTLQPPSTIKLYKGSQVLQPEIRDDRAA